MPPLSYELAWLSGQVGGRTLSSHGAVIASPTMLFPHIPWWLSFWLIDPLASPKPFTSPKSTTSVRSKQKSVTVQNPIANPKLGLNIKQGQANISAKKLVHKPIPLVTLSIADNQLGAMAGYAIATILRRNGSLTGKVHPLHRWNTAVEPRAFIIVQCLPICSCAITSFDLIVIF